jgi:hypothetical protein
LIDSLISVDIQVSVTQHNIYLSMSANNLEDEEDDVGDGCNEQLDNKLLGVPHSHYNIIWDCPKINKVSTEVNGISKHGWRCDWCMNPPAMFALNATKALAYVLQLPENGIHPCQGIIPESYLLSYRDLYHRHLMEGCVHQMKKSVMSDGIDNIQERMSVAMLVANTNKKNKRGMVV